MSNTCTSKRSDSIFDIEWMCQRNAGHLGQHQRINKNFYPSKPDILVNMVWDERGASSTKQIPEPLWDECLQCGLLIGDETYSGYIIEGFCFGCSHWNHVIEDIKKKSKECFIIDETLYSIGSIEGHGGRLFRIRRFGSDEIIETRKLWSGGKIPEHFQEELFNNAEFIPEERTAFKVLNDRKFQSENDMQLFL